MRKYIAVGIALDRPTLQRVDKLAAAGGVSRNHLFRRLVDVALGYTERGVLPDIARLLTLQEHQTLILDKLVRNDKSIDADRLAMTAHDNLKKYHGA